MVVRYRDRSSMIARLAVGVLLLAAIVTFVDVRTVVSTAKRADLLWIVAALALLPINLLLESAKWRLLLSRTIRRVGALESVGSVLTGYALGFVTPARFGECVGRALSLEDTSKGDLLVMAMLDRLYSVWIYVVAGTVLLGIQLESTLHGRMWWLTFAVGGTLSVIVGMLVLRPATLYTVSRSLLRWRATRDWRRYFLPAGTVKTGTGVRVLLLSLIRYGVFCTQFVLLVLAFSPVRSMTALYAGVALVFFVKTIIPSVSLFDLGIRESAAIFFLGFVGVDAAAALSASLLLFVVNLALPALVGAAFVPGLNWMRLRRTIRKPRTVEARTG